MRFTLFDFLLQWSTGGLFFLWVTTRRKEISPGYGWLLRSVFGVFAVLSLIASRNETGSTIWIVRGLTILVILTVCICLVISKRGKFPPTLDVIAPVFGAIALLCTAHIVGGPYFLSAARLVIGSLFLGVVSDAMLLGHWYLVQPKLGRGPIQELVRDAAIVWPFEVLVFLIPTGMIQVANGTIDDGWNGLLFWTWLACAVTTIVLIGVTWKALQERYYSAVMAATGLLYLAILTGFGTDLIARAVLS